MKGIFWKYSIEILQYCKNIYKAVRKVSKILQEPCNDRSKHYKWNIYNGILKLFQNVWRVPVIYFFRKKSMKYNIFYGKSELTIVFFFKLELWDFFASQNGNLKSQFLNVLNSRSWIEKWTIKKMFHNLEFSVIENYNYRFKFRSPKQTP